MWELWVKEHSSKIIIFSKKIILEKAFFLSSSLVFLSPSQTFSLANQQTRCPISHPSTSHHRRSLASLPIAPRIPLAPVATISANFLASLPPPFSPTSRRGCRTTNPSGSAGNAEGPVLRGDVLKRLVETLSAGVSSWPLVEQARRLSCEFQEKSFF